MTRRQRIAEIDRQVAELRAALHEALLSGVQSASLGSAGASQSYTRLSPGELRSAINDLLAERAALVRNGHNRRTSPDFDDGGSYGR